MKQGNLPFFKVICFRPPLDNYYDHEAEAAVIETHQNEKKKASRQHYTKRVIVHSFFHNIGFKEAEKLLANMDQGECIFRPSSKVKNKSILKYILKI